jgi:type II secretory pathway component PulK
VKPCQQKERGTVLLTTLLIMTVMAAITVALMEDIQLSVKRTINVQAYAQADWQADGAEDFVTAYLKNDFQALAPVAKAALLQSKTPLVLPTPDGAITLTLKDGSQCSI